jgi:uncharacterized protein with FMN-binding domain
MTAIITRDEKGRVPNNLVAASCAAVLAVYAAGYWRTQDDARDSDARSRERQPPRVQVAAADPLPLATATQAMEAAPLKALLAPPQGPKTVAAPSAALKAAAPATPAPAAAPVSQPVAAASATTITTSPAAAITADAAAPAMAAVTGVAPAESAAASPSETLPAPAASWRDGTYTGWGTSRHGDIKAQVVISNGRIVEAGIASCETRYPCDVIQKIIHQPVDRQSADAYYYGLVEALTQALVQSPGAASAAR